MQKDFFVTANYTNKLLGGITNMLSVSGERFPESAQASRTNVRRGPRCAAGTASKSVISKIAT
eukprot:3695544-Amphidinium_carterae.1